MQYECQNSANCDANGDINHPAISTLPLLYYIILYYIILYYIILYYIILYYIILYYNGSAERTKEQICLAKVLVSRCKRTNALGTENSAINAEWMSSCFC